MASGDDREAIRYQPMEILHEYTGKNRLLPAATASGCWKVGYAYRQAGIANKHITI
jgi:hypothetical protein